MGGGSFYILKGRENIGNIQVRYKGVDNKT